jgi:hypothetical protein
MVTLNFFERLAAIHVNLFAEFYRLNRDPKL